MPALSPDNSSLGHRLTYSAVIIRNNLAAHLRVISPVPTNSDHSQASRVSHQLSWSDKFGLCCDVNNLPINGSGNEIRLHSGLMIQTLKEQIPREPMCPCHDLWRVAVQCSGHKVSTSQLAAELFPRVSLIIQMSLDSLPILLVFHVKMSVFVVVWCCGDCAVDHSTAQVPGCV